MKTLFFIILILLVAGIAYVQFGKNPLNTTQPQRFWQITSVDTVKYSRDAAGDANVLKKIPFFLKEAAKLHVTHVAIDTPYDERFYPVLKAWVDEARKNNLKVWFRGNFSGWEGWFGYQQFESINQHNQLTNTFIAAHPDLFQDGDIFTPIPEPENGGPGDPRGSQDKTDSFNTMLVSSYNNCVTAFQKINKQVNCGYFSTNGDIAKDILTPSTVAQMGNIIVIDHYVDSPEGMQEEINALSQKFPQAKIVLGEFGAPIPDINGEMTESQQSNFIAKLLDVFYANRTKILGINYWTLAGGSTSLLRDDNSEKEAFTTIANYFFPSQLQGIVKDTAGNLLNNVLIYDKTGELIAITGNGGTFSVAVQKNATISLSIKATGYKSFSEEIQVKGDHQKLQDIKLQPDQQNIAYKIRLFINNIFSL